MIQYIARRVLQMFPTVLGVIMITFILFNLVGGSPAVMTLGRNVSPRQLEEFDELRGFNKPLFMGWWSGTRAFADQQFETDAGPWRGEAGVSWVDEKGASSHLLFAADAVYPMPLEFSLRPGTGYRWIIRYRLPEGQGAARMGWVEPDRDADDPEWREETALPSAERWTRRVVEFEAPEDARLWVPAISVEGGDLQVQSIRLQRRARHFFDSQFVHYVGQIMRLDLGTSSQTEQPIGQMIRAGIVPSLTLTVPIFLIGLVIAVSLALVCAFFRNTWLDRFFVVFGVALMSVNYLVWIIVGQYVMAFRWGWFPVWGYESMGYLLLPVVVGVVSGLGTDLRFYRTVMLDEMYKEYVRTAFAKGVSRSGVLFRHVLKNAMITVVTNVVIAIPFLYTGSLLLESFFGIPGLGYMGINAINSSDVDVIRAIVLIGSILYVLANLLTDICYAWVDPRVKLK